MRNREYKNLGIKNYYDFSKDGRIIDGIAKDCKKLCRRNARKRLKRRLLCQKNYWN